MAGLFSFALGFIGAVVTFWCIGEMIRIAEEEGKLPEKED